MRFRRAGGTEVRGIHSWPTVAELATADRDNVASTWQMLAEVDEALPTEIEKAGALHWQTRRQEFERLVNALEAVAENLTVEDLA